MNIKRKKWKSKDGSVVLYLANSFQILTILPTNCALITDPPYGINVDTSWLTSLHVQRGKPANKSDDQIVGDDLKFDITPLKQFKKRIVFGHPYIEDPDATGWLIWDKQPGLDNDRTLGSPAEIASSTCWKGFRICRCLWQGYYRNSKEKRYEHPTQKPLKLMSRCIQYAKENLIIDPFMGSGSTGVAAVEIGKQFIGIEIEEKYFEIAKQRIINAIRKKSRAMDLKPKQL